ARGGGPGGDGDDDAVDFPLRLRLPARFDADVLLVCRAGVPDDVADRRGPRRDSPRRRLAPALDSLRGAVVDGHRHVRAEHVQVPQTFVNPKSEYRNPKQTHNPKFENKGRASALFSDLRNSDLFWISIFGFRILGALFGHIRLRRELDVAARLKIGVDADGARELAGAGGPEGDGEDVDPVAFGRAVADGHLIVCAADAGNAEGADAADHNLAVGLSAGSDFSERHFIGADAQGGFNLYGERDAQPRHGGAIRGEPQIGEPLAGRRIGPHRG